MSRRRDGRGGADGPGEGPTGREALEEMERRLGALLGTLAQRLGEAADAADAARGVDVDLGGGRGAKAQASVRVRVGGLDVGAASQGARGPAAGPPRPDAKAAPGAAPAPHPAAPGEPRHELHDDAEGWSLIADLPGATPEDLRLSLEDGRLIVEALGPRPRRLEVPAPARLALDALEVRLVNGILELRLPPAAPPAASGAGA